MTGILEKVKNRQAVIGVVGLGQVGLRLSVALGKAGYRVVGYDNDSRKVNEVSQGKSCVEGIESGDIAFLIEKGLLRAEVELKDLNSVDVFIICVPAKYRKTADPDLTPLGDVLGKIRNQLRKGQVIIVESCVGVGTTEGFVLQQLSSNGFEVGEDFYLACSPERLDPGNKTFDIRNTPKIIGGVTERCSEIAKALYQEIVEEVTVVSSPCCAELVKFLENGFRAVNIGLVNELALMCNRLGVDVWEVVEAAGTKPFGFMSFYPGPGFGGYYPTVGQASFSSVKGFSNYKIRLVKTAEEINAEMSLHATSKIVEGLSQKGKSINGSQILVLGVTYKKNVNDYQESPALDIIGVLGSKGARVFFHDPYVEELSPNYEAQRVNLTEQLLKAMDCAVIVTDHDSYDYEQIVRNSNLVVDTRNATKTLRRDCNNIITI